MGRQILTRLCAGLVLSIAAFLMLPGTARAQGGQPEPVILVGLRPTDAQYRDTKLRRLRESLRLSNVAGGVIRMMAERQVMTYADLREVLGRSYLVAFVECHGQVKCVSHVVRRLKDRATYAVYGDYSVVRDTYTFRMRLINIRTDTLVHEVVITLNADETEDRKLWYRELSPLIEQIESSAPAADEDPEPPPPADAETPADGGGLPELSPISTDPSSSSGEPDAGEDSAPAAGDDEPFIDAAALEAISRGVALHGHLQNYAALGYRKPFLRDLVVFDNRLQLDIESTVGPVRVVARPQLLFDTLSDAFELRLREAYASRDYQRASFTMGTRILAWGITDFWPVVDILNPRNFSSIRNWRPIDEKLPVPVIQTTALLGRYTLHLLALPVLAGSEYQLDPSQPFALPVPSMPGTTVTAQDYSPDLDNSGGGVGVDIELSTHKLSLYALVGRNPLPTIYTRIDPETMETTVTIENERVAMGAISFLGTLDAIGAVLKAEAAAYVRLDDRCEGLDQDLGGIPACFYLRRVPTARATVGIERAILTNLDAHLQFISEFTVADQVPTIPQPVLTATPGFEEQPTFNPIVTLRLQGRWLRAKFRPMLFAYWSFEDEDFFVNLDFQYHVADGFAVTVGGFIFQGYASDPDKNRYTFAGSLENSSNGYLRVTAWF